MKKVLLCAALIFLLLSCGCGRAGENKFDPPHIYTAVYRAISSPDTTATAAESTYAARVEQAAAPTEAAATEAAAVETAAVESAPQTEAPAAGDEAPSYYVLNTRSKKIHLPTCSAVKKMAEKNYATTDSYANAVADGYAPCKICNP